MCTSCAPRVHRTIQHTHGPPAPPRTAPAPPRPTLVPRLAGTYVGPFVATTNGYFALWVGFLYSVAHMNQLFEHARQTLAGAVVDSSGDSRATAAMGLFVASVVLLAALLPFVQRGDLDSTYRTYAGTVTANVYAETVFALCAASVSAAVGLSCILLTKTTLDERVAKALAVLLALAWIAVAGVLTFRAPFKMTGNGFFASYAGLYMSFQLFGQVWM